MPASSAKQRAFMGAVLGRKRAGKPRASDPKMSEDQLKDFAMKVRKPKAGGRY